VATRRLLRRAVSAGGCLCESSAEVATRVAGAPKKPQDFGPNRLIHRQSADFPLFINRLNLKNDIVVLMQQSFGNGNRACHFN
jgi:hypothetical protein